MLNHHFHPERKHLIVTLDVEGYNPPRTNDFLTIYRGLAALLPTLNRHTCCDQWENTPLFLHEHPGVSIKSVGEVADVAHLVEHVIVDLQCRVANLPVCSGITCGHREQENRFDLFVECPDARVGGFATHFAVYLVGAMFAKPRLSRRYRDIIDAAQVLVATECYPRSSSELTQWMGWSALRGRWAYAALMALGLLPVEGSGADGNPD